MKFAYFATIIGAFALLGYLMVSLIYITPQSIKYAEGEVNVDIEGMTLESDQFYFRKENLVVNTRITYIIENLNSEAILNKILNNYIDVEIDDYGNYDVEYYEERDVIGIPTYAEGEFYIRDEGEWVFMVVNEHSVKASFSLSFTILTPEQFLWKDSINYLNIWVEIALTPLLTIGAFIGLSFGLLNLSEKIYIEDIEENETKGKTIEKYRNGYRRKKYGNWIK